MTNFQRTRYGLMAGLLAFSMIHVSSFTARAQEVPVGTDARQGLVVTIYNGGFGLVKDTRTVSLKPGDNHLSFVDVSALIQPETALFQVDGVETNVLEQNFNFDLLTYSALMQKSVGKEVRIVYRDPETGKETVEQATVLSFADGTPVLQIGDKIQSGTYGQVVFGSIPENLRARPTLTIDVNAPKGGSGQAQLTYLTPGLTWKTDYVVELNDKENGLNLNGWVTLTNSSGTSYTNATLQLVAGNVNAPFETEIDATGLDEEKLLDRAQTKKEDFTREALLDYHLYTLGRNTNVAENQTKQVALLSATEVPAVKEYRLYNVAGNANAFYYTIGEQSPVHAGVYLSFDNKEESHLGLPLPQGAVRVYRADKAGRQVYIGADSIEHTPKGETIDLSLGEAFDVTARLEQDNIRVVAENRYARTTEASIKLTLKNAKAEPVLVHVREQFPPKWDVRKESIEHKKISAGSADWPVTIPAEGETVLSYTVRVTE